MRLYDTFQDSIVDFAPNDEVRMYVCGITPYDATHLGHANTYLAYDLLIRRLQDLGHNVNMVCNITDVDDSILPKARELGVDFAELAATETARFHDDMKALCRLPPRTEPKATEWIAQMIEMITKLSEGNHVYSVDGTYWFDVATWPEFGSLSKLDQQTMLELAAERGGSPDDPRQRNPLDFVLWQPSLPDEPKWDSPFGTGRPGWHIECSAMSMGLLGDEIDLHGGGTDLIFPHHECEIVQSEAATGNRFVKHWMHCGMVAYQGTKMSKSLGNLVFVNDLTAKFDPAALRLALMGHHYREDWEWYDNHINEGVTLLDILNEAANHDSGLPSKSAADSTNGHRILDPRPFAHKVRAALDDDLDSPQARNVLIELAQAILAAGDSAGSAPAVLRELCELCGIQLKHAGSQGGTGTPPGTQV